MGKIFHIIWWVIMLLVGAFASFSIIVLFNVISSVITKKSKTVSNKTYGVFLTLGLALLVVDVFLIIFGLKGTAVRWWHILIVGAGSGFFLSLCMIINDGRKIWKSVEAFASDPSMLRNLITEEENGDDLEQVRVVAIRVYGKMASVYNEIDRLVEQRLKEIQQLEAQREAIKQQSKRGGYRTPIYKPSAPQPKRWNEYHLYTSPDGVDVYGTGIYRKCPYCGYSKMEYRVTRLNVSGGMGIMDPGDSTAGERMESMIPRVHYWWYCENCDIREQF